MAIAEFTVKGMSCTGCAQSVERRLLATQGVQSAAVDLATAKATVTFDDTVTDVYTLESVIENLGYDVVYGLGRRERT